MGLCNFIPPMIEVPESVNRKILNTIMTLPDGVRKEVRLLAKQYEILEVYQNPPITCDDHIVRVEPWLVKYRHFGDEREEFTWTIDANRMH